MFRRLIWLMILTFLSAVSVSAQTSDKPMILPFRDAPGIDTWLLGQAYGNTTGAYRFGDLWYSAGQGLHFGLDFSAACGTPLVATADGVVSFVDNLSFGSAPHNVILRHEELGLSTLYGHLQERAPLVQGQLVQQGDFIGYSGDPDGTCDSRPHLHLEIRTLDYRTALNPVDYIDANWHMLASIGRFGDRFFQMDLDNARQWMSLDDQPRVAFGGRRLNAYQAAWPPTGDEAAPPNPPLARDLPPLTNTSVSLQPLETSGCCTDFWWHPVAPNRLFTIDGFNGQQAQVLEWDTANRQLTGIIGSAPPPFYAPDQAVTVTRINGSTQLQRVSDGTTWFVNTGSTPALNPGNTRLMWVERGGAVVPGSSEPQNRVIISTVDGQEAQVIAQENGVDAQWLDSTRLLLTISERPYVRLDVYNITNGERFTLGRWYRPRDFRIAPGGERLMFYLSTAANIGQTGVYVIDTVQGAEAQRMDWFGAYRWRDADSVYFIPYLPESAAQQLWVYDLSNDTALALTDPATQGFMVMNGRWQVNADGSQIIFRNAIDRNLWTLTVSANS